MIEEIRRINVPINNQQEIRLKADVLCKNPGGAMHIGFFAKWLGLLGFVNPAATSAFSVGNGGLPPKREKANC